MKPHVLHIEGLHMSIRSAGRITHILRGVDLTVRPGEVHALVGESGGGKSMVTRCATGLMPRGAEVTAGRIVLDGQDMTQASEREWRQFRGRVVSMVLQDPMTALNPMRMIAAQVSDVLRLHRRLRGDELRREVLALLDRVHIREPERVMTLYPHELSGGMRQRVVIAMAWACQPKLIICDEPTTALDVTVQKEVLKLIRELAKEGQGVLFVTHDLGVVAKVASQMSVIHTGRILESGTVADVYAAPKHPYTSALLGATPRFDRPGHQLRPVSEALIDKLQAEALQIDQKKVAA